MDGHVTDTKLADERTIRQEEQRVNMTVSRKVLEKVFLIKA